MKVGAIRNITQLHLGRDMQLQYLMQFINEGMQLLANRYDSACKRVFTTINATQDSWIDLPKNCVAVTECKLNGRNYHNYSIEYSQIKFQDDGDFHIGYLTYHDKVTTETEEPKIHDAYHYALALFSAAREKQRIFGDEDSDSLRLMQEFFNSVETINSKLSNMKKAQRRIAAPLFR